MLEAILVGIIDAVLLRLSSNSLSINATSSASSSAIDLLAPPSYLSFASAPRPAANLLMIVPIGTPSAAAA